MNLLKLGSTGPDVSKLQLGLIDKGFLPAGQADGKYGPKTEDAVSDWQDANELYSDGVFGKQSVLKWNAQMAAALQFTAGAAPRALSSLAVPRLGLVRVQCDVLGSNGFSSMMMRADVAVRYNAFRNELLALGSGLTSAGSIRGLGAGGGSAQSATSMHYAGLAWDMALGSMMQSLNDPYVMEYLGNRRWRMWARCRVGAVPEVTLTVKVCHTVNKVTHLTEHVVSGPYVNLTAMAEKHGFRPISSRPKFLKGGAFTYAEVWHWQAEALLYRGVSTFGSELLKLYSESQIRADFRGDWDKVKGYVFGEDWN